MRYGYVRVSTDDQDVGRQLDQMRDLGILEENIFVDHASGKDMAREGWQRLMGIIAEGDLLAVDALDRLGRDYDDLTREWKRITREVGCDIAALDLDFFDSRKFRSMGDVGKVMEDMLLSLLSWKAQREREDMMRRTVAGVRRAQAEGKCKGKPPKRFGAEVLGEAQAALDARGKAAAAEVLGVTRQTVYNMIADGRLVA